MNCQQVQAVLGCFHDGELEPANRAAVQAHLENCAGCAGELAVIAELSELTRALAEPEPPGNLWESVAERLVSGRKNAAQPGLHGLSPGHPLASHPVFRLTVRASAVAALVLAAVATGWFGHKAFDSGLRVPGVVDQTNADDPNLLLDNVLAAGAGEQMSLQDATHRVDFQVFPAADLPDGYCLKECYLCRKGCCDLVQCKFLRQGEQVLLVQGSAEYPVDCGERPVLETQVNGKAARVIQCKGCLACNWQSHGTALTLVGPRDLSELVRLVSHIDQRLDARP
jgi:hypothetical protein